ncbi:MAG: hypothetical protein HYV02_03335 [Deltaproteobacteria bacterium]|nr:hypothetical protein [Deltaproteobacteria bacterium]
MKKSKDNESAKDDDGQVGRFAKLLRLGVGAFWMTEESVRKALLEMRMPKEATAYLLEQIDKRKGEIFQLVRDEIQRAVERMDATQLVDNILANHDIEISAKIRLTPRTKTAE